MSRRGALGAGRGRRLVRRGTDRRTNRRWCHPPCRPVAAARTKPRRRPERFRGQQDRGRSRHHARRRPVRDWRLTVRGPSRADRAEPRRAGSDAATHRPTAHRLRGRLVDHPDLERGSPRRSGRSGRASPDRLEPACDHWSAQVRSTMLCCKANQVSNPDSLLALRVNGVEPVRRSRLPGAHHRARRYRACTTPNGFAPSSSSGPDVRDCRPHVRRLLRQQSATSAGHDRRLGAGGICGDPARSACIVESPGCGGSRSRSGSSPRSSLTISSCFPLYALADRSVDGRLRGRAGPKARSPRRGCRR